MNELYVVIGVFIGMLIIYSTCDVPKIVIKEPTLNNIGKVMYIDGNGCCYKYKKKLIL